MDLYAPRIEPCHVAKSTELVKRAWIGAISLTLIPYRSLRAKVIGVDSTRAGNLVSCAGMGRLSAAG